jgi:ComF family protein
LKLPRAEACNRYRQNRFPMNTAKNILLDLAHLFFPHTCLGCGSDLVGRHQMLCLHCLEELPQTNFMQYENNPVEKIFHGRVPVFEAASLLYFSKDSVLQHLLHQFKYRGKKEIGLFFGRMMGVAMAASGRFRCVDLVIPLPLFAAREKKRGYNQAAVLCDGISTITSLPVVKNAVARIMPTESQTHKNRIERWQNIAGSFAITKSPEIAGKHLLLVDDVVTTGATLEACAVELLRAGGSAVSIVTLAYTIQ